MEEAQMKFCPDCDYQGRELICPICHKDMIEDPTAEDADKTILQNEQGPQELIKSSQDVVSEES